MYAPFAWGGLGGRRSLITCSESAEALPSLNSLMKRDNVRSNAARVYLYSIFVSRHSNTVCWLTLFLPSIAGFRCVTSKISVAGSFSRKQLPRAEGVQRNWFSRRLARVKEVRSRCTAQEGISE
jgi:hypothetical protein